ncbi:MAG TPA: glycerophosphodiester phosphodiesterase [Nitrospirota bacterium]|nr:glycerophosphodiester phosphodiesterase [Nitrospirota bacterium]
MNFPLVIAHRGDPSAALENSLEAIHHALSYPVDMIEVDIRRSRDNMLYVMHDKNTQRTAKINIDIEKSSSAAIARIKLKNKEPVPTLTDVIKVISGKAGLNLEVKSDGAGLLTAEYLASSDYRGYVLVSSFKEDELFAVRRVLPALPTSMIFDVFTSHDVSSYSAKGYKIISLRKMTVNEKLVELCHEQGIQVYVWTVDEEEEMKKMISWSVDGIYSNKPGVLKSLIEKLRSASRS